MNPLITTVVPTYRRPVLLRRAIRSVLAQSYPHVRLCVYDNASGDETAEMVAAIAREDDRVVYQCRERNIGAFANFARGLDAVDSPYFSLLSDDDVLLPGFYARAVQALEQRPEAAFWGGTAIVMREDGTVKDATDWPDAYYEPPQGLRAMIENNYLIWTSLLFRTGRVAAIGGLDPEVGGPIDTDYLLRVAAQLPFMTSSQPAAVWMTHPESSTVLADLDFIWPGWLKTIRNVAASPGLPDDVRAEVEHALTEQLKRQLFQTGYAAVRQGRAAEARRAAGILRDDFGQTDRARLLSAAAQGIVALPPSRHLLTLVDRLRRWPHRAERARISKLQARLGHYARFIALS